MRGSTGRLLGWLCLALGSPAFAAGSDAWHGDVHVDVPVTYVAQSTGTLQLSGQLEGSYFFKPLVDDGVRPLGLLGFLQHPGLASLTVTSFYYASLAATAYPWESTGFTASMTTPMSPTSSLTNASYSAGILHYVGSSLRLELLYLGTRSHSGGPNATDALLLSSFATDRGQLDVSLAIEERALLSLTVGLGSTRGLIQSIPLSTGALTTVSSTALTPSANLSLTGYFGRRFSASLTAAASGASSTATAGRTVTADNALTLSGGAGLQQFVTDAIYLRANYHANWTQQTSGQLASSRLAHALTVTLGGRL